MDRRLFHEPSVVVVPGRVVEIMVMAVRRRLRELGHRSLVLDAVGAVMFGSNVHRDPQRAEARGEPSQQDGGRNHAMNRRAHAAECARSPRNKQSSAEAPVRVARGLPMFRRVFVFSVCRLVSRRCHNIPSLHQLDPVALSEPDKRLSHIRLFTQAFDRYPFGGTRNGQRFQRIRTTGHWALLSTSANLSQL